MQSVRTPERGAGTDSSRARAALFGVWELACGSRSVPLLRPRSRAPGEVLRERRWRLLWGWMRVWTRRLREKEEDRS